MHPRKQVRALEKHLKKDPTNLVLRVRLASALAAADRAPEAMQAFRAVAAELPHGPDEIAFFDDKAANVEAAQSVGLAGRLFETREGFVADIRELTGISLA